MPAPKVLLADSDTAQARSIAADLRRAGYEILTATDAIHTMNAARSAKPDVIVLSGQLAGGGALAALQRVRSNVFTTHIPVVGLAGKKGANTTDLMKAGAQACLKIPVAGDDLVRAIGQHKLESLDFTEAPAEVLKDSDRMKALKSTKLLDTPAEESFDRLTRLVSRLLGVPTALVTLVDRERQFFKSQVGLPKEYARKRETDLSHSFCQWVVSGREPVVVADAKDHPTLKSNLAIQHLNVIAYAGVPLYAAGGQPIGSFCAIDSSPRQWKEEEVATLFDMALVAEGYAGQDSKASAHAVRAVAGLLRRFGARLTDEDRADLASILEEKSDKLLGKSK